MNERAFITIQTDDGVSLRGAARGEGGRPLLLLQGRTEFIEKYDEVIARLVSNGFRVFTFDWRGQGGSGPETHRYRLPDGTGRGHVDQFAYFDRDLDAVLNFLRQFEFADEPIDLLAHSMGGLIGLRGLIRRPHQFRRAVFSCPMWGLPIGRAARTVLLGLYQGARVVGRRHGFAPTRGSFHPDAYPFENNGLTSDRHRFERFRDQIRADLSLGVGGPTIGWLGESLLAMRDMGKTLKHSSPTHPIAVFSAELDRIVENEAHNRFVAKLPNARLIGIAESLHEPLMERDAIFEDVMDQTIQFLLK